MLTHSDTELLNLLGKAIDHPRIDEAVSELSAVRARELQVQRGLVHVRARDQGLDLTFKPAGKLRDAAELAPSPESLVLAVIFFHSNGFEGYSGYAGILPYGLRFEQSRSAVRSLLGPPSGASVKHKTDRWDRERSYVTVDFADDEQSIRLITVGLLWKPRQA